ncbi:MAG TPA: circularly permuted type 2 ATP-grasp protein, partial [Pseudoduganella sp.]
MPKFYDEMYSTEATIRSHYDAFAQWLALQPAHLIEQKRAEAELIFQRVGITFAVYGDNAGKERLIPFDIIPRVIDAAEWARLQEGLVQRVTA